MQVDATALDAMVGLSHGYPFFIQLCGREVWAQSAPPEGPGAVTTETFGAARSGFEHWKLDYYRQRYRELRKERLLPVARSVAAAFGERAMLDELRLEEAIRAGLDDPANDDDANHAEVVLSNLGFLWETSPDPGWEPGIPSLMDYVLEHAPAP